MAPASTASARHTPGPWRVGAGGSLIRRIFSGAEDNITTEIATVFISGPKEAEANARLIAASPKLLLCCQAVLPLLRNYAVLCRVLADESDLARHDGAVDLLHADATIVDDLIARVTGATVDATKGRS